MRNVIKLTRALVLVAGLAGLVPALVPAARAETTAAKPAAARPDAQKLKKHLEEHQTYPATRADLIATCQKCPEFSAGEKRWYADHLPEGTYKSAAEVIKAVDRK